MELTPHLTYFAAYNEENNSVEFYSDPETLPFATEITHYKVSRGSIHGSYSVTDADDEVGCVFRPKSNVGAIAAVILFHEMMCLRAQAKGSEPDDSEIIIHA